MRKEKEIRVTRKLLKQLKPFWRKVEKIRDCYNIEIVKLEERMARKTSIESIKCFSCGNDIVGIGNVERTPRLIHDTEFE